MAFAVSSRTPLLLLFVSAIFIYSYHRLTIDDSVPAISHPIVTRIPSFNPSNFTFTIKVLAFDRLPSISRCLKSLADADYGADKVSLHIYIDHSIAIKSDGDRNDTLSGKKLAISHHILDFVDGFKWESGEKIVHYRTRNAGLQEQWLEAWWPESLNDFAFVVEDDLEVSPLFYKFLKGVILNYYYDASNFSPLIYGASLQRPRFVPGKHGNKMHLDTGTGIFLYQLVGTWGQLLFPKPWKEFRLWYDIHKAKGVKPVLDGMVTTGWYKKMGERIWTPWFIKFLHSHPHFNLYTTFPHEGALSVSHRDAGVNYRKSAGPDSILIRQIPAGFERLFSQPPTRLKWYDFCFREVHPGRHPLGFDELDRALSSLQRNGTLVLAAVSGTPEPLIRNLLCHFEFTGLDNFLLLGRSLGAFSRVGHPVVDTGLFSRIIGFENGEAAEEMVPVLVYVVGRCLRKGYSVLVLPGNSLPVGVFWKGTAVNCDFLVDEETGILFVRGTESARKVWAGWFGSTGRRSGKGGFLESVKEVVEREGGRVDGFEKGGPVLRIDGGGGGGSGGAGLSAVVWSPVRAEETKVVRRRLEELKLWHLDEDNHSCRGVYCRGE